MEIKSITFIIIAILLTSCTSVTNITPTETALPHATMTITSTSTSLPPSPTQTLTAKEIYSLIPTIPPTPTFIPPPLERADYDEISGTYRFERGEYNGCVLNVVLEPTQEIGFDLFCMRGAPSYNSGYGIGKILISNNVAVYSPSFFYDTDAVCDIVFQFEKDKVTVTQLGTGFDCGFGHAVYADGVYELVATKPPQLGCLFGEVPCPASTPES